MSDAASRKRLRLWVGLVVGGVLGSALLAAVALRGPGGRPRSRQTQLNRPKDNPLAQVRKVLARQPDLAACRTAVQLLNSHLQNAEPIPPLTPSAQAKLRDQLALHPDDLNEISSATFTPLDAAYLDERFLFHDAARSLEVPPVSGPGDRPARQSPLDRAVAGFDWVVRQVRLAALKEDESEQAPPAAILRRGLGTPLQRSLVFLALLEQFGLEDEGGGLRGCLLLCPDAAGAPRLWACGVIATAEPGRLYLFDPRVGLPVPGPGGKGVATLAQARSGPGVFAQWKIDKIAYDVTPEQAGRSSAYVVVPMSAASPRLRFLQDRLLRDRTLGEMPLPAPVHVHLADDPDAALEAVRSALVKSGGKAADAHVSREGAGLLRRFLRPEDGGSDPAAAKGGVPRSLRFLFNAVPWAEFPSALGQWIDLSSELGRQLSQAFARPYLFALADPNSSREMLLRARFSRADPDLVSEQEVMQQRRARLQQATDLGPGVRQWLEKEAIPAYADLIRARGTPNEAAEAARVAKLWLWKVGDPMEVLINGSSAGPRGAEVTYQLALSRHERAVRSQLRLDLAATVGVPMAAEAENARKTWLDAEGYWREFLDVNPKRPGVASAQRLRGEALARLGQTKEAIAIWKDLSAPQADLERLARLWLARQRGAK